jgi:flagellin-specific chaperone FliS
VAVLASTVPSLRGELLDALGIAASALAEGESGAAGDALGRAGAAIDRLIAAPAPDHGSEAAARLLALYRYFGDEAAAVSRSHDLQRLTRLSRLVAGVQAVAVHAADAARSRPSGPHDRRVWRFDDAL